MSANADLITVETDVQQENTIENQFSYMGQIFVAIWWALEHVEGFQWSDWAYLTFQLLDILSSISVHVK